MSILSIPTARVFLPLLQPNRYKGAYGGRGSAKSHFFADNLIRRCVRDSSTRAVCIREYQSSLKESVKRLLEDKIRVHKAGAYFDVLDSEIRCKRGEGLINFTGMQAHNAESIKSLEGYDIAYVEEAQNFSKKSLRLLRPTIRKPGSELWFSWNPRSPDDPVDELFRSEKRLPDAISVEANWLHNPWFPADLRKEMADDAVLNPEEFDHVWNGAYETKSDAIIFSRKARIEAFDTPSDARFFHGADWGFAQDPTALVRTFIQNDCLMVDAEAFGVGVELEEIPQLFDSIPTSRLWPIKADGSRPETISYVRRKGFQIDAAEKWPGSVEDGIAHLKGFKAIIIHPRCTNMATEKRRYSYKVDRITEQILPIIVDKWNHGWDAIRYSLDGYIQRRGGLAVWAQLAS